MLFKVDYDFLFFFVGKYCTLLLHIERSRSALMDFTCEKLKAFWKREKKIVLCSETRMIRTGSFPVI